MKKSLAALMTLAVLSTTLAGCGNSTKTSDSNNTKATTVTIMHHMGEDSKRNALKTLTDAVTKANPNIKFEITNITDVDQYRNTLRTKLAAGDPPDIIFGNASQYKDIVQAGHIADLTSAPFIKNCNDDAVKSLSSDNKVYGVPVDIGATLVYYNKDIFKANGLSVPTTYAEYIKICDTLKSKNIAPIAFGMKDSWIANVEVPLDINEFLKNVPDFYKNTEARTKKFADFSEFARSLERTSQRVNYAQGDIMGIDHNAEVQMFATGKAAMLEQGTWDISSIRAASKDGNFGVFALPADKAEDTVLGIGVDDAWMVASQSKNKDAVYTFFNYITSAAGAKTWAEATSTISATKGVDSSKLDPMAQDVVKIIDSGKVLNTNTIYSLSGQMSTYFNQWSQEFVADKNRNVKTYIDKLDKQFDSIAATK